MTQNKPISVAFEPVIMVNILVSALSIFFHMLAIYSQASHCTSSFLKENF